MKEDGVPMTAAQQARFDQVTRDKGIDRAALARAQEAARPDPRFWYEATTPPIVSGWRLDAKGRFESVWTHDGLGISVIRSVSREEDGRHWLHVSCAAADRIPSYPELLFVKECFVGTSRTAVQVFPPRAQYINVHPYALHLRCLLEGDLLPDFSHGTGSI